MLGFRQSSAFAAMAAAALPQGEALRLVDVGWASGLAPGWSVFGDRLRVLAIAHDTADAVTDGAVQLVRRPFQKRSEDAAPALANLADRRAQVLDSDRPVPALAAWLKRPKAAARPAVPGDLMSVVQAEGFESPDVLKLDSGADDLALLRQLEPLLAGPGLLAVVVRLNLFGGGGADEDTAHNVDRLLRAHGFDLYSLHPARYASAALPMPFIEAYPGAASGGRVVHAQALYLRPGAQPTPAAILKTAALMALAELPDQAAELLATQGGGLPPGFDLAAALDLLTAQVQEDTGSDFASYGAYVEAFERRDPSFFSFDARRNAWLGGLIAFRREGPARIQALEDTVRDLSCSLRAARSAPAQSGVKRAQAAVEARSLIYPGHHAVFDHYRPYRGPAHAPSHLDFIGSLTPPDYGSWPIPLSVPDYEEAPPQIDEEYFEWIDILQAVLDAGPTFTMLELGAGYGRWSARAAVAARQKGKAVRLGAAEAEPRHKAWLEEHLQRNGVAPSNLRIFGQAIGGAYGEVAFTIAARAGAEASNWFGQAIMPLELKGRPVVGDYYGLPVYEQEGWQAILVPKIPLSDVLAPYDLIDIADFDLQGSEAEAIAEAIVPLTRKARRLHIGTHSEAIEAELRDLLPRHGWVCLRDYSLHKTHDTPFGRAEFVDGVQSWINPALI
jgi:FkbM family methyltransferase